MFGSPETAAAALSYAASQINRLMAFGDVAAANKSPTTDLLALRRAVERDRYGLMAYVLAARDHCTPSDCAAFRSLTDTRQITTNMEKRAYDGLVGRYAFWNAPRPRQRPWRRSRQRCRPANPPTRIFLRPPRPRPSAS